MFYLKLMFFILFCAGLLEGGGEINKDIKLRDFSPEYQCSFFFLSLVQSQELTTLGKQQISSQLICKSQFNHCGYSAHDLTCGFYYTPCVSPRNHNCPCEIS